MASPPPARMSPASLAACTRTARSFLPRELVWTCGSWHSPLSPDIRREGPCRAPPKRTLFPRSQLPFGANPPSVRDRGGNPDSFCQRSAPINMASGRRRLSQALPCLPRPTAYDKADLDWMEMAPRSSDANPEDKPRRPSSRLPGFYDLPLDARLDRLPPALIGTAWLHSPGRRAYRPPRQTT